MSSETVSSKDTKSLHIIKTYAAQLYYKAHKYVSRVYSAMVFTCGLDLLPFPLPFEHMQYLCYAA